ncbi:MAG: GNAT family N-acetyltransferase [Rhizobiaceae bacterium]
MEDITFRAVTKKDAALLGRWIALPHWQEWWGEPAQELADIFSSLDSEAVEPMIVELGGKPFAYAQTYDPHLEADHPYQDQPFGTIGVDISIGEAANLNKGHGSAILKALAELLFEEGTPRLIIDPDPTNAMAIRAYEKAGFKAFDTRTSIHGPALMMALDNPDFTEEEDA